jgi:hypothetical protein
MLRRSTRSCGGFLRCCSIERAKTETAATIPHKKCGTPTSCWIRRPQGGLIPKRQSIPTRRDTPRRRAFFKAFAILSGRNSCGRFSSVEVEREQIMKANNETATLRAAENTARGCSLRGASPIINLLSSHYGSVHSWFHHGGLRLALASSRTGRVLLHALCVLRRPSHSSWHWRGIVREFSV